MTHAVDFDGVWWCKGSFVVGGIVGGVHSESVRGIACLVFRGWVPGRVVAMMNLVRFQDM